MPRICFRHPVEPVMLPRRVRYALRALRYLSRHEGEFRPSHRIATEEALPAHFLDAILNELKLAGFVESARGLRGGFRLIVPAQSISVLDVLDAMGVLLAPLPCLDAAGRRCEECRLEWDCELRPMFEMAIRGYRAALAEQTICDAPLASGKPVRVIDPLLSAG